MTWPIHIRIDQIPPSLNTFVSLHWKLRGQLKKVWADLIAVELRPEQKNALRKLRDAKKPMKVDITIHLGRRYDPDNLQGGPRKIILDAMMQIGILFNDSARKVSGEIAQKLNQIERFTEIDISEEKP